MIRFQNNFFSQATKGLATWLLVIGLVLVGFGVLILSMPEIFAFLAALVFFFAGIGFIGKATKLYFLHRKMDQMDSPNEDQYRQNVRIHVENREDL